MKKIKELMSSFFADKARMYQHKLAKKEERKNLEMIF